MPPTVVISFGYRHGKPKTNIGDVMIDIRTIISKNPYHDKRLRQKRGDHQDVIKDIELTPNLEKDYNQLLYHSQKMSGGSLYIGCTGGHHRSVYIANRLAKDMNVDVLHLNYKDK